MLYGIMVKLLSPALCINLFIYLFTQVLYFASWGVTNLLYSASSRTSWQWSPNKIQRWKCGHSLCIGKWLEIRGKISSEDCCL